MEEGNRHEHVWSIVLAGGEGVRMKEFVKRRLSCEKRTAKERETI